MKAPRIAVSGGTGYVGRFVVEALLAAGQQVTVLGRSAPDPDFFSQPVSFRPLSLEPAQITSALLKEIDGFVHAAFDHVPGRYRGGEGGDPAGFRRRNLNGSVTLFEAAKLAGVRRVVFLSSRAVYGPRARGVSLYEAEEARPDTLYGEVKLAGEKALNGLVDSAFVGTSLRVTGVYGPAGPGRAHKWAQMFDDFLAGQAIAPRAGTEVHGRDVAQAVLLALQSDPASLPRLLNVSDIVVDRRDILDAVKRLTGSPNPLPEAADKTAVNAMRGHRLEALGWSPGGMPLLERTIPELLSAHEGA